MQGICADYISLVPKRKQYNDRPAKIVLITYNINIRIIIFMIEHASYDTRYMISVKSQQWDTIHYRRFTGYSYTACKVIAINYIA